MDNIPMDDWGKDHWSTFAYAATRCVDNCGALNRNHLRMDGDSYPTRLKSGKTVDGHNDTDCVRDCQEEGLLTYNPPMVVLTDKGWDAWLQLQKHKAKGGQFGSFEYKEEEDAES